MFTETRDVTHRPLLSIIPVWLTRKDTSQNWPYLHFSLVQIQLLTCAPKKEELEKISASDSALTLIWSWLRSLTVQKLRLFRLCDLKKNHKTMRRNDGERAVYQTVVSYYLLEFTCRVELWAKCNAFDWKHHLVLIRYKNATKCRRQMLHLAESNRYIENRPL